tara:strand:+ start:146 stop:304 length:159 start_codon:yes stop_codon:yes gene_type:complete
MVICLKTEIYSIKIEEKALSTIQKRPLLPLKLLFLFGLISKYEIIILLFKLK